MNGFTIAVEDQGTLRKITKIVPYKSGGFAVLAPYHKARRGYLAKHPVDYSKRDVKMRLEDMVAYSAEDRVKLSIHPDGFVQFSSENQGKIVSGRDPQTGEPKGLGLVASPLSEPINTGPTFGCVLWGTSEFEPVKKTGEVVAFGEEDYYYRRCTPDTWNGYLIEGFVFPDVFWGTVRNRGGKLIATLLSPMFETVAPVFDYRVVPLPGQPILLGFLVSRVQTSFSSPSGFSLHSPSDLGDALFAQYPPQLLTDSAESLDYRQ